MPKKVIKNTIEYHNLMLLNGFVDTNAFPGESEILIACCKVFDWIEITITSDLFTISHEIKIENHYKEELYSADISKEELDKILNDIFRS